MLKLPWLRAAAGLCLIAAVLTIADRIYLNRLPDRGAVNGTYFNACCDFVTIDDHYIRVHGKKTSFRLMNMKFGLTAFPDGDLAIFKSDFGADIHGAGQAPLIFDSEHQPKTFSTVDRSNNEFKFVRKIQ